MRRAIQLALSMMLIAFAAGFHASRVEAQQANPPQGGTSQTMGRPDPAAMSALRHKYLTWGQVHKVKLHSQGQGHGWQKSHPWRRGSHTGWQKDHPWRRGHWEWRTHHRNKGSHLGWLHAHRWRHEHHLGWKFGPKGNGQGQGQGQTPAQHNKQPARHHHGRERR